MDTARDSLQRLEYFLYYHIDYFIICVIILVVKICVIILVVKKPTRNWTNWLSTLTHIGFMCFFMCDMMMSLGWTQSQLVNGLGKVRNISHHLWELNTVSLLNNTQVQGRVSTNKCTKADLVVTDNQTTCWILYEKAGKLFCSYQTTKSRVPVLTVLCWSGWTSQTADTQKQQKSL